MNSNTLIPKRETIFLTASVIVASAVVIAVYLILGKYDYTVLTGAILGSVVTVFNFIFLSISVNRAVDRVLETKDYEIAASKAAEAEAHSVQSEEDESDSSSETDDADDEAAKFARAHEKKLANAIKVSYIVRMLTMVGALVLALFTGRFDLIATAIPLFMQRPALTLSEITKKKEG